MPPLRLSELVKFHGGPIQVDVFPKSKEKLLGMCQFRSNLILTLGFKEINKIVRIQALAEWKVFFPFKITFLG